MSICSSFNSLGCKYFLADKVDITNFSLTKTIPQTSDFNSLNEEFCYVIDNFKTSNFGHNQIVDCGFRWVNDSQYSCTGIKMSNTNRMLCQIYDDSSTGSGYGYREFGNFVYKEGLSVIFSKERNSKLVQVKYGTQTANNLSFAQPLRRYSKYIPEVYVGILASSSKTSYTFKYFHYNNPQYDNQCFTFIPMRGAQGKGAVFILETRDYKEIV